MIIIIYLKEIKSFIINKAFIPSKKAFHCIMKDCNWDIYSNFELH